MSKPIEASKKYVKILAGVSKRLTSAKPKDRLDYTVEIARCLNTLTTSINGWRQWLTNLDMLKELSLEDMKKAYPEILEATIQFLTVDIEITTKKIAEAAKKIEKIEKKRKKGKDKDKKDYIA